MENVKNMKKKLCGVLNKKTLRQRKHIYFYIPLDFLKQPCDCTFISTRISVYRYLKKRVV